MNKYTVSLWICFLILVNKSQAQDYKKVSENMEINNIIKLIGMEIDDATSLLTEYNFNMVKKEVHDGANCLLYEFNIGECFATIRLYYTVENKVKILSYIVANKNLRKSLNDNIKKLKLVKNKIQTSDNGIITFYEGKSFKYIKDELVNSSGFQQVNFSIIKK